LGPDERLADWRNFRKSITEIPELDQFNAVVNYWSRAPLKNIAYDIEDIENFPTPWEMIYAGDWCRNSIAIGMEFTLRLAGIDEKRLELRMINDSTISDMMLTVVIDSNYVLNYDWGHVFIGNLSKDAKIIKKVKIIGGKYRNI
jgi:sugar phosphate isomerase/epimerase